MKDLEKLKAQIAKNNEKAMNLDAQASALLAQRNTILEIVALQEHQLELLTGLNTK